MHRMIWTALGIFSLTICTSLILKPVFADSFFDSGGDIAQCSVSLAPYLRIKSFPFNAQSSTLNGGIGYDSHAISGNAAVLDSFSQIATDAFPSAQLFPGVGMAISVPPASQIEIRGVFKNANSYDVVLSHGFLYTTSGNNDIERLATQRNATNQTSTVIYNGKTYSRNGNALSIPLPSALDAGEVDDVPVYSFTTITPINATRTITYSFSPIGELLVHFQTRISNITDYTEDNIQIHDEVNGVYSFSQAISLAPHTEKDFSYDANFGTIYSSNLSIPPVSVIDPNTHTEILQQGELTYEQNAAATAVYFNRSDFDATPNWSGTQSSLPFLTPAATIAITLIPYTLYTSAFPIQVQPDISITKTQNGSTDAISDLHIGDGITYSITITNTGNAPGADVFISDTIDTRINITDPGGGTVCTRSDQQVDGFLCTHGIVWPIGTLGIGQSVHVNFLVVVANNAVIGDDIFNVARVTYNTVQTTLSNQVDATLVESAITPQITTPLVLAAFVSISSGSILGIVWNDMNMDGVYDPNSESVIAHALIHISYGNISRNVYSDSNGGYEVDGLPFNTPIHVSIPIPIGYSNASTYGNYEIALSGNPQTPTYTAHNGMLLVQAGQYFNAANLGVYKGLLPDTGQNAILVISSILLFWFIGIIGYILGQHIFWSRK